MRRTLLLITALLVSACGEEPTVPEADERTVGDSRLYVRASGMVKALGIT